MSIGTFTGLLVVFATLTSLITEGVKKTLENFGKSYASNVIVLFVSIIVGGVGLCLYYVWNECPWTTNNIISIFLMTGANWLGSMVGYDKVIQTITQVKTNKKNPSVEEG